MNNNKLNKIKHKALGIITKDLESYFINQTTPNATTFKELSKVFNMSKLDIEIALLELIEHKEVIYYNVKNIEGYFPLNKGLISFQTRKYINRNKTKHVNTLNVIISIIFPLLTIIISTLAIFYKSNELEEEITKIKYQNEQILKEYKNINSKILSKTSK